MKRFYIVVSNPGASRHAYFSGMAATLAAMVTAAAYVIATIIQHGA